MPLKLEVDKHLHYRSHKRNKAIKSLKSFTHLVHNSGNDCDLFVDFFSSNTDNGMISVSLIWNGLSKQMNNWLIKGSQIIFTGFHKVKFVPTLSYCLWIDCVFEIHKITVNFLWIGRILLLARRLSCECVHCSGTHLWFLFAIAAAGVVTCGVRKMSPGTLTYSRLVQFVVYFWTFEVNGYMLWIRIR